MIRERFDIVTRLVPPDKFETLRPSFIDSLKALLPKGITSFHSATTSINDEPVEAGGSNRPGSDLTWQRGIYDQMGAGLPRSTFYIAFPGEERLKAFGKKSGDGDDRVRLGGIGENLVDGGFTGPTAWLLADYRGQPGFRGKGRYSDPDLQAIVDWLIRFTGFIQSKIMPALATHGVRLVAWADLESGRRKALKELCRRDLLPVLTPLAIDESRPFPLISSLSLNLALRLDARAGETEQRWAIVQVPPGLPRLVPFDRPGSFVLEEIVAAHAGLLFPGQAILELAAVRLARDAELELDDEGGRTQLEMVEREVRRRRRGGVTRLEVSGAASEELVLWLRGQLDVGVQDVYVSPGPLDMRVLSGLVDVQELQTARDPAHQPVDVLADAQQTNLFSLLDERPLLLHHPYETYDPVIALVAQAADDPDVVAIKQTLYRTEPAPRLSRACSWPPSEASR